MRAIPAVSGARARRRIAPRLTRAPVLLVRTRRLIAASMPELDLIEYDPLIDSSNVSPQDWANLATQIRDNYYDYDGFVILHGTDTMAYTASALSFMLQGLGKPVVVTGSIIPLCEVPARRLHVPEGLHCAAAAPACPVASRAQAAARRAGAPACG